MSYKSNKLLEELIIERNNKLKQLQEQYEEQTNRLQALEEKQSFIESILTHVPGHLYWLDRNNVYLGCNEEHAKIAGLQSRFEIVGKTNLDLPWRDQADVLNNLNNLVMSTGKPQIKEESTLINNTYQIFLSKKVPLRNKINKIIGVLCISIEITELKKMEKELKVAKEKAESANYIMTEFISNMGHDLATPISDVGSVAQVLDCYSDEYPEFKELFETLITRCEACEEVRKHIINATSISNLDIQPETFSITQELLMLEKELRPGIDSKNLKLIIRPFKSRKEDSIETDRSKFHAILYDLMSNAINFTEEGEVTVSVLKKENRFHIKVADTGLGIPADKFDYIFEQYTKLSRSNKYGATFKGVGAGLYLARIRANILQATISVESKVNKGSIFTLSIPCYLLKK